MTDNPVNDLIEKNAQTIARLKAGGFNPEPLVSSLTLTLLLELTYPSGSPLRSTFDAIFESNLESHLEQAEQHRNRERLTEGVQLVKP